MVNTLKLCIAEAIRQKLTKRFKGTFRVNFGLMGLCMLATSYIALQSSHEPECAATPR
jgi:hypothetical protein